MKAHSTRMPIRVRDWSHRICHRSPAVSASIPATVMILVALLAVPAWAQQVADPVVARVAMQLRLKDKVLDTIAKGDLLTVTEEKDDSYAIVTFNGHRGVVSKVNAVKLAESVEIYSELIKESPRDGRLYILRAPAWWARGDEKRALADYDRAIELGYDEPHAFSSRGMFHAALGDYDKAIADYSAAISADDEDPVPLINRAAVYMTQKKHELAIKDYDEAIRRTPRNANLYQQRAVAWKLSGELPRAIQDFSRALKVEPNNIQALMGRGFVWFQLDKSDRAIDDFTRVIELNPQMAEAYNNRGYNLQLQGKYEQALADYERAIEVAPSHRLALQNKAWLLSAADDASIRDGKAAIRAANAACELSQFKDLGDLKALAAAFAEDGQFSKAVGWQEKIIAQLRGEPREFETKVLELYKAEKPYRVGQLDAAAATAAAEDPF